MRMPIAATAVLAVVSSLWALFLGWWHLAGERTPLDRVEASLADVRLLIAGRKPPQSDVVIIAIDDATVSNEKGYPI